jgi:hypothetical protein
MMDLGGDSRTALIEHNCKPEWHQRSWSIPGRFAAGQALRSQARSASRITSLVLE